MDSRDASAPPCAVFDHELVVRPSDLDAAGHLNHVSIVAFFEHGRVKAHHDVRRARPDLPDMNTVVRHVEIDYLAQAPLFASLRIRSWVRRDGRTSRAWAQELLRPDGTLVARAQVVSVLVDRESGRPSPLPAVYREAFAAYAESREG